MSKFTLPSAVRCLTTAEEFSCGIGVGSDAGCARGREPAFCGAERACLWELCVLAAHVHPSVVAMARTLLAGATIIYEGDPLRDLTLSAFLDKFVQKKPKVTNFPCRNTEITGASHRPGSDSAHPTQRTLIAAIGSCFLLSHPERPRFVPQILKR